MYLYQKISEDYIIQSIETRNYIFPEDRWYITVLSPSGFINQHFESGC